MPTMKLKRLDRKKRVFDIVVSSCLIVLTLPLMVIAFPIVALSSPGPLLYRQQRVGLGGRPFDILKFRTMRPAPPEGGRSITVGSDSRITPGGQFLRHWKIDELPQLFNVLIGEMSLVGPRPEVPEYVAHIPAADRAAIQSVRPGVTDLASIKYRHEAELLGQADDPEMYYIDVILKEKARLGAEYANRHSLAGDLVIIFKTALKIFSK